MFKKADKRIRGPNYTITEKIALLDLAKAYKNVIENKKTDKTTTYAKKLTWEKICSKFNAQNLNECHRNCSQLKTLYENLKHDAKKEKYAMKNDSENGIRTKILSEVSQKTLPLIESDNPLENSFDKSGQYNDDSMELENKNFLDELHSLNENQAASETDDIMEVRDVYSIVELNDDDADKDLPANSKKRSPALRGVYKELSSICNLRKEKIDKQKSYDEILLEMRREKHELEMKLLQEQIDNEVIKRKILLTQLESKTINLS